MENFRPEVIVLTQSQTECSEDVLVPLAYVTLKIIFKSLCKCVYRRLWSYVHLCVQVSKRARRGHSILQNWIDRDCIKLMLVLGTNQALCENGVVLWIEMSPKGCGVKHLVSIGGSIWEGEGRMLLKMSFKSLKPHPLPQFVFSALCL